MTRTVTLAQIATIFPGTAVPGKVIHDPRGGCQIIVPRQVGVDGAALFCDRLAAADCVRMDLTIPAERVLRVGDIVFMSRGEKNRAAVIATLPAGPCTVTNVFHVIRPHAPRLSPVPSAEPTQPAAAPHLVPAYLAWALNQQPLQDAIRQIRTAHVAAPLVRRDALAALTLPCPDLARQNQLVSLAHLMQRERELRARLLALTDQRHRLLGVQLLTAV